MGFDAEKIKTTKQNIKKKNGGILYKLNSNTNKKQIVSEENVRFKQRIFFNNQYTSCYFKNCYFEKGFEFTIPPGSPTGKVTNIFDFDIHLEDCKIDNAFNLKDCTFKKKFRIHDCEILEETLDQEDQYQDEKIKCNFENTKFNDLADFWRSTFHQRTIFYKTDFNSTVVFSFAKFKENVLFTYSLFGGKSILAKTEFNKGLDLSQAVIKGDLQLFDLKFDFKQYTTKYIGKNHLNYQDAIDSKAIIPLENKVHTFQILKKGYIDIGNYSDSILMQREEKRALRELTQERYNDKNTHNVNFGDRIILWLNRWSSHYQSDFRNGILFTLIVAIVFGFLTLVFTESFWLHLPSSEKSEWDIGAINNGVKLMVNFLNPVHKITYIHDLKPFLGIPYIFDFFGRIAVGYGIYQTVQAFRKFK